MITYQEENWTDVVEEMEPIFKIQWEEVGLNATSEKGIHLNPQWETYEILESKNMLHVVTVRKDKKLIGHYVSVIAPHLHSKDILVAQNDFLYVSKEHRKGLVGYKLIKFAVEKLKARVHIILLSMNAQHAFLPLTNKLGFKLTDYNVMLEV